MNIATIFTLGNSQGNPGPSAIAIQIVDTKGAVLIEFSEKIGNATADFAAYQAVMRGLQAAKDHFGTTTKAMLFEIKLDNEFVKKQLSGEAPIHEPGLVPYFIEIHNLHVSDFPQLTFALVSQESNKHIEKLLTEALAA
jgi:ribonuclease HI